jgi:hypothetical protein
MVIADGEGRAQSCVYQDQDDDEQRQEREA